MHSSSGNRGSSRSVHLRTSNLVEPVPALSPAAARGVSRVFPRLSPPGIRLPVLRKAGAPSQGDENSSPCSPFEAFSPISEPRQRPDAARRATARAACSTPSGNRPWLKPVARSSSPLLPPTPHRDAAEVCCSVASPPQSVHDGASATAAMAASSALTTADAMAALLSQQQYVELYFVVSARLPCVGSEGAGAASSTTDDEQRHAVLLGYRSLCSAALMRYKECCEDGVASLAALRRPHPADAPAALRTTSPLRPADAGADDSLHRRVAQALVAALVVREKYTDAAELLDGLPASLDQASVVEDVALLPSFTAWRAALPALAAFRLAVAARRWTEGVGHIDRCSAAQQCVAATPLCAMLAFVRLELGDAAAARALLLPYVAALSEPPSHAVLAAGPVEHAQLLESSSSHYVFTTTLLAKATFMSGNAYLNIAAALLQRVLRLSPTYAPARLFAEFVLAFEAQQQRLEAAMASFDFAAALAVTVEMLRMPEVVGVVRGELFLLRTQAQWMRRQPLEVVQEAAQCLRLMPHCALALRLRADALAMMGRSAEAAADAAAAALQQLRVGAAFAELQAQRTRYHAAQHASQVRRQTIPVFAPGRWPSPPLRAAPARAAADSDHWSSERSDAPSSGTSTDRRYAPAPPTHYDVLGVVVSATEAEIRQRYRRLTLQYHPDRLVGATEEHRRAALETFQRVGDAYSVLADAGLRAAYDAALAALS